MFFLIGGVQPRTVLIETQARVCPFCGYSELEKKRVDHYLSLFFIPLFPVKKGVPFLVCSKCQGISEEDEMTGMQMSKQYKKCKNCGRFVQLDFSFCPYCGKLL